MMAWRFVAIHSSGHEVVGAEWGTRADVLARLAKRGLHLVSLEPDVILAVQSLAFGASIPPDRLTFFFRDFSNMLAAGITLNHMMGTLKEAILDPRLSRACDAISCELAAGRSLAEAMAQTRQFPRLAVNAVKAGERAGNLPLVTGLLADHFELSSKLKGKCLEALIYPACVVFFLLVSLVYVSQSVVPQLAPLLPAQAMDSPLTRVMLALSGCVRHAWIMMVFIAGGIFVLAGVLIRRYPRAWYVCLRHIPGIGHVNRDLEIGLCFFDIFVLLRSGIPLDTALREAASSAGNLTGAELEQCCQYLAGGHTFSSALAQGKYFPRLVVETIRLGEEMGRYDDYCERVFKLYYRSFETRVSALVGALQPVLLGVCAVFVIAMAFAFLKPIYANLTHMGVLKP